MKPLWQSKLVMVNAITMLIMALTSTEIVAVIPKEYLAIVAAVVAFANVILRVYFTNSAVRH